MVSIGFIGVVLSAGTRYSIPKYGSNSTNANSMVAFARAALAGVSFAPAEMAIAA